MSSADHILAAARRVIEARGLDATTIDEIAAEAGVSRATLYRRSGGREAILIEVLRREAEPFVVETNSAVRTQVGIGARMIAGIVHAVGALPRYPLLQSILSGGASDYKLRIVGPVFRTLVDATIVTVFAEARARGIAARTFDPDELADWLLRDFLYVVSRAPWEAGRLEAYLETFLVPVLEPSPSGACPDLAARTVDGIDRLSAAIDAAAAEAALLRRAVAGKANPDARDMG